eukprot:TRINITY_DN3553_c0_g1_i1.p1 TRINITY_DN3553_c0_g1~~TRINITY_DN3553_c0_g1_i1.p1  ORF type:complete len:145 (-),score=44.56 TRINITY_DN3553_c0_g1_i1:15-449(-)
MSEGGADETDNTNNNSEVYILDRAAFENWDISELESALKETTISDKEQEELIRRWRVERPKVHERLVNESTWNNRLEKLSWRIDSKTKSRKVNEMNELTSIVEMKLASSEKKQSEVVRFEMTQDQLKKVLAQVNHIQQQITKFA